MRLVDRSVGIGGGRGIGVGDRDRAKSSAADLVRRLAFSPFGIEQRIVFVGIAVRPAIDRDGGDIARRNKPLRTQYAVELVADLFLEGRKVGRQQARSARLGAGRAPQA